MGDVVKAVHLHDKVQYAYNAGSDHTGQDDIVAILSRLNLADQLAYTRQLRCHVVDPLVYIDQC